jgi:simple sugar transport system ATP-binding protein
VDDASSTFALQVSGISKRFPGVLACDNVSLTLRRGEVLGLLGENGAGKTTLMNIVYGLYQPDDGAVIVDGRPVRIRSPQHALELGIGMVHQHFMLVPDMTVAENMALGPSRLPGLSRIPTVEARVRELSERFGLAVDPQAKVQDLAVGVQQRVEIVKMLYRGAGVLILDEPTAALTPQEWRDLAVFLRRLVADGASVILITHKLDELVGVADRCTILRDGAVVDTVEMKDTNKAALARLMVGRDVTLRTERPRLEPGRPVVGLRGISLDVDGVKVLDDVSLEIREHEVLGLAGVSGNGQEELVAVLTGLRAPSAGEVLLDGEVLDPAGGTKAFIDRGGALVPEDRHRAAVALSMPLWENIVMKEVGRPSISRFGLINRARARQMAQAVVEDYEIKTPGIDTRMSQLSGGNQQKAVFGRELRRRPRLLVAAQPTRGLDIGAMEFVYGRLNEQKTEGCAVLLISSELDEILSLSDRIAVICGGRIMRILDADQADPELLGLLMAGEDGVTRG